jgi:hypothetical protein
MALAGSVLIQFKSDYGQWLAGSQKVRTDAARTNSEIVEGAKKTAAKTKSAYSQMLSDLNESFGKRSALGKTLKLAAGGGVIGGLGLVTSEFAAAGKSAREFAEQMGAGEQAGKSLGEQILLSIPLVGHLTKGAEDFASALSGAAYKAGALRAELAKIKEFKDAAAEGKKATTAVIQPLENQARLIGKKGSERIFAEGQIQYEENLRKADDLDAKFADLQHKYNSTPANSEKQLAAKNELAAQMKDIAEQSAHARDLARQIRESSQKEGYAAMQEETDRAAEDAKKKKEDAAKHTQESIKDTQQYAKSLVQQWADNVGPYVKKILGWRDEVKALAKDAQTPFDKLQSRLDEIKAHTGLFGLTDAQAKRLRDKATADFKADTKAPPIEAIERRSSFTTHNDELKNPLDKIAEDTAKEPPLLTNIYNAIGRLNLSSVVVALPGA